MTAALPAEGWRDVRRLLVVRLDNLGDLLMTTPALAALRDGLPQAHITLLASPGGAALAPHLPTVDAVRVFEAPWVKSPRMLATAESAAAVQRLVQQLAAQRFDAVVVFTVCTQSALPMALAALQAAIPLRLAHCRENPYGLLSDWVHDTDRPVAGVRHEVTRQLELVGRVGFSAAPVPLSITIDDAQRAAMRAKLAAAGGHPGRGYVVMHPGASAPSRRYPAEGFARAAGAIVAASGCQVVLAGSAAETAPLAAALRSSGTAAVDLAGCLELGELAALIAGAQCTVCNNSAPAHLAAAVGSPVVVLYALTNPQHTPWQATAQVLSHPMPCRDCLRSVCPHPHHGCLRGIDAGEVAHSALQLIARRGASRVPA